MNFLIYSKQGRTKRKKNKFGKKQNLIDIIYISGTVLGPDDEVTIKQTSTSWT